MLVFGGFSTRVIAPIDKASPNTRSERPSILGLGFGGSSFPFSDRITPNNLGVCTYIKIVPPTRMTGKGLPKTGDIKTSTGMPEIGTKCCKG